MLEANYDWLSVRALYGAFTEAFVILFGSSSVHLCLLYKGSPFPLRTGGDLGGNYA